MIIKVSHLPNSNVLDVTRLHYITYNLLPLLNYLHYAYIITD